MNWKKLSPLIGIGILAAVLYFIDLKELGTILKSTNLAWFSLAVIVSLSVKLVMNNRWRAIMQSIGVKIPYLTSLAMLVKGITLGTLTPGKVGDLYRAKYLRDRTGISIGEGFSTVVLDRLLDLLCLVSLGGICSFFMMNLYIIGFPLWIFGLLGVFGLLGTFIFFKESWITFFLRPIFNFFVPENQKEKLGLHFRQFYDGLNKIPLKTIGLAIGYTLLIWFINFLVIYILARALNIEITFIFVMLVYPIITLLNLIPVSVFGLGTNQITSIYLLGLEGVSPEAAVALSFLMIFVLGWIYALPGAVLFILRK